MNEFDHVGHALHRLGYGPGGEVKLADLVKQLIQHYHEFMTAPEEALTQEQATHIHDLSEQIRQQGHDPTQFLTPPETTGAPEEATLHADGGSVDPLPDDSSDLPKRAGFAVMKHFYGPDEEGHLVLGPSMQMQGVKELEGLPYRLSTLADKVLGMAMPGPMHISIAESPLLSGSKAAAGQADDVEASLRRQAGLSPATTFPQHVAENVDAVTPIPGLAAEGAASHALGWLGGAAPKAYPRMAAEWDAANAALESLMDKFKGQSKPEAKADGGQPQQPFDADAQDTAPVEAQEQNEMLQRRMFQHPTAPIATTLPPPQMADGGQPDDYWTDVRRRLAILQHPMLTGTPSTVPPHTLPPVEAERAAQMTQEVTPEAIEAAKAALSRLTNLDLNKFQEPDEGMAGGGEVGLAERLAALIAKLQAPAEHEAVMPEATHQDLPSEQDLQAVFQRLREHLSMPPAPVAAPEEALTQPETTGLAGGGDIRRKPAILENPFEVGRPPGIVPAFERPQAQQRQPQGSTNFQQGEDNSQILEALRARLMGGHSRGGPARRSLPASRGRHYKARIPRHARGGLDGNTSAKGARGAYNAGD